LRKKIPFLQEFFANKDRVFFDLKKKYSKNLRSSQIQLEKSFLLRSDCESWWPEHILTCRGASGQYPVRGGKSGFFSN
jgi:hypothetical protein